MADSAGAGAGAMTARMIQGHRGFSECYPENTMSGYQAAFAAGAGGLEADVRRTRDGVFVLCHDPTLDRTTSGRGSIAEKDWAEIDGLDASYPDRFGEVFNGRSDCTVLRLTDLLDAFRGKPVWLILHIKALAGSQLDVLLGTVTDRHMLAQCHFFGPIPSIDRIKGLKPAAFTLNDGMPGPATYRAILDNAVALGHNAVSVSPHCSDEELLRMVGAIHCAGKLAHASYVAGGYARDTQRLLDAGVDHILGNDPAAMVEVLRAKGYAQVPPQSMASLADDALDYEPVPS